MAAEQNLQPPAHDHAPDLRDPAVDIEDAPVEAICQIDLEPEPQSFTARALRQALDAP